MKRKIRVTFENDVMIQIKNVTFKVLSHWNKSLISMGVKCALLVIVMIFLCVNEYIYVVTLIVDKTQRKPLEHFLILW